MPPFVPPLKCQGIKTKLVGEIATLAQTQDYQRWIEPFCGSCVVALNVQPKEALLSDSNVHIIRLYQDIQRGNLTAALAKSFLAEEGDKLRKEGEPYYYKVRERFNARPTSLDFLFLNRSCFNGVMRFNRAGKFNVPYGHKPERFAQAYMTKNCQSNQANLRSHFRLRLDVCPGGFQTNPGIGPAGRLDLCGPALCRPSC